jgi:HD-GYP domain-containing protein (c-di-GMP phosphodiesterase class II)
VGDAERLERLAEVAALGPGKIIDGALAAARDVLEMDLSFFSEIDAGRQEYVRVAGDGEQFGLRDRTRRSAADGYCELMIAGRIPNLVADTHANGLTRERVATATAGAYVGVPLELADGSVYGTFCCLSGTASPGLEERDVGFVRVLARLVADEIDRREIARERELLASQVEAGKALLAALDARERYTAEHSKSVVDLSIAVARQLQLDDIQVFEAGQVALLHDIGKVGVGDAVLNKADSLTEAEWEEMREHPAIGARIVAQVDGLAHLAPAIRAEHERWDGTGYPDGLSGDEIPLSSQICFACDSYHAMTSDRPYRQAMPHRAAIEELRAWSGKQFSPRVVDALLAVIGR